MAQEQDKERAQPVAWRVKRGGVVHGYSIVGGWIDGAPTDAQLEDFRVNAPRAIIEIAYAAPQPNAALAEGAGELVSALKLALEYWEHRQQRYKNRSPVWVQRARAAIAKVQPPTLNASKEAGNG